MGKWPQVTEEDFIGYGCATRDWKTVSLSLPVAARIVKAHIGSNIPEDDEEIQAYKFAVIAAALVDTNYGQSSGIGEGISSLHIGSFTVSASTSNGSSYMNDMGEAIKRELYGSGLLYGGVALGGDC